MSSIGRRSCEIMKEKTPLPHEVVCFQMLDFETSNSKSEVSKSNAWKITSFSKTMLLQREPFLTVFYTINSSPLLVTKEGFMIIIILSNYQYCPVPLKHNRTFLICCSSSYSVLHTINKKQIQWCCSTVFNLQVHKFTWFICQPSYCLTI